MLQRYWDNMHAEGFDHVDRLLNDLKSEVNVAAMAQCVEVWW
jgi:hypothetical protein